MPGRRRNRGATAARRRRPAARGKVGETAGAKGNGGDGRGASSGAIGENPGLRARPTPSSLTTSNPRPEMNNNHDTRQAVLDALQKAGTPMDAYQVAKAAGVSPIQAARTLTKLSAKGIVQPQDPLSDEADLSARFTLAPAQKADGSTG